MLLHILRALFIIIVVAVIVGYAEQSETSYSNAPALVAIAVGLSCIFIGADILIPQKSLLAMSGVFFGLLVGLLLAYGASLILDLFVDIYNPSFGTAKLISTSKIILGLVCCYITISFILQTKDDVRFVIPYVEFAKQRKGQRPLILDTSVIIDGRIVDILNTWTIDNPVLIPRFVLQELQAVADSSDKLKRNRGRRGLDIVNKLQGLEHADVKIYESAAPEVGAIEVDQRLLNLASEIDGRIATNDYNLNKVAQIRKVEVININDLANAIKPVFLPGEHITVRIVKPGEERGQGVGYLDDGTMVVVENARDSVGSPLEVTVTSVLQTSAGRMVFGRPEGGSPPDTRRRAT